MAASRYPTTQHLAADFVESCGAVLFRRKTRQIALLFYHARQEYLLAKGRRNLGEARHVTAAREVGEETGLACRLVSIRLDSRCPPPDEVPGEYTPDVARSYENVVGEPFMMTWRDLSGVKNGDTGVKLIWWFIGEVVEDESGNVQRAGDGEKEFTVEWFDFEEVLQKSTFAPDREILAAAINIWKRTFDDVQAS